MMELLVGILGVIATIAASIIGYFLGLRQGRKQYIYEQRVRAVTEIRSKLRAVQQDFLSWSAPPEYQLEEDPSRLEQGRNIVRKLDALEVLYESYKPLLDPGTRNLYEAIAKELDQQAIGFLSTLEANAVPGAEQLDPNVPYDEDEVAAPVFDWAAEDTPGGLSDLKRRWDEEAERVIDGRPWYSRLFGRRQGTT